MYVVFNNKKDWGKIKRVNGMQKRCNNNIGEEKSSCD